MALASLTEVPVVGATHTAFALEVQQAVRNASEAGGPGAWCKPNAIRACLKREASKLELNRCLYNLKETGVLEYLAGTPPLWRLSPAKPSPDMGHSKAAEELETVLHVVVDLGNVHCCLQHLVEYARAGLLTVSAYADLAYSGYGVSPPLEATNVRVYQSDTADKNSADVQIIWDVSRLLQRAELQSQKLQILVATKDLGFQRLKALVEESGDHSLVFVTNWSTLKLHIE